MQFMVQRLATIQERLSKFDEFQSNILSKFNEFQSNMSYMLQEIVDAAKAAKEHQSLFGKQFDEVKHGLGNALSLSY